MVLRVGYIHKNFVAPLLQFAEADGGKTFKLIEYSGGTAEIITGFRNDEIDIGIALTGALIASIAKGNSDYRLVGQFVTTSMNWAVVVGYDSRYKRIQDLKGTIIGISGVGSESHGMTSILAMQQEWYSDKEKKKVKKFKFKVNTTLDSLVESVNDGSTSSFLWEWWTIKPYADDKQVRVIGSVPTPWPSWMIAAHTSPKRAPPVEVREFLATLNTSVQTFSGGLLQSKPVGIEIHGVPISPLFRKDSPKMKDTPMLRKERANIDYIISQFGYEEMDVREWLSTVQYPSDVGLVPLDKVVQALIALQRADIVKRPKKGFEPAEFTLGNICRFE
ncbi:periplasmic binding protein-like II [Serendipita vermifera]|nr:periplasmic binding protein-like II [Serendipita vermifera]